MDGVFLFVITISSLFLYTVFLSIIEIIENLDKSIKYVVDTQINKFYVSPRVIFQLSSWHQQVCEIQNPDISDFFISIMNSSRLESNEFADFVNLCAKAIQIRHRFIPMSAIKRKCTEQCYVSILKNTEIDSFFEYLDIIH